MSTRIHGLTGSGVRCSRNSGTHTVGENVFGGRYRVELHARYVHAQPDEVPEHLAVANALAFVVPDAMPRIHRIVDCSDATRSAER